MSWEREILGKWRCYCDTLGRWRYRVAATPPTVHRAIVEVGGFVLSDSLIRGRKLAANKDEEEVVDRLCLDATLTWWERRTSEEEISLLGDILTAFFRHRRSSFNIIRCVRFRARQWIRHQQQVMKSCERRTEESNLGQCQHFQKRYNKLMTILAHSLWSMQKWFETYYGRFYWLNLYNCRNCALFQPPSVLSCAFCELHFNRIVRMNRWQKGFGGQLSLAF